MSPQDQPQRLSMQFLPSAITTVNRFLVLNCGLEPQVLANIQSARRCP